jgi:hypothetical protein
MANLAVIFAELTGCEPVWRKGLEGFAVNESKFMREMRLQGKREGLIEERREMVKRVLRSRPWGPLPAAVVQRIGTQGDADVLSRWFDLALSAATLDAFLAGMDG